MNEIEKKAYIKALRDLWKNLEINTDDEMIETEMIRDYIKETIAEV